MFKHFLTSANEGNAFILACDETREAILVDVGEFEPEMAEYIETEKLNLTSIFITHDHYDHSGGLREAVDRYGAAVYAGAAHPGGCKARKVAHGDLIRVGTLAGKVIATPGHTPDALSLAFPGMVFTGDALFAGSVGGTSSPAQAKQQLDAIKKHIFSLPPETEIHTGHGPSSTVAIESRYNPFFV
ncbi:MAG TPA: MBL fold metallo-hydrolase [Candidatus Hydrogenedentes bacterium]|nr:MBL fold metallo-hydrolase [Candidatus Hydrogenedentota bacterium]HQM47648.1 MBL fold metallo-hydrolase [Candidatus Hydrogenedentota bacterium]